MISPMIPISPMKPNLMKKFILTPDMNNKTMMVTTIIIPVPKSGWSIINPKINITIERIGRTDVLISFILFVDKYFAVKMIIPNLANSLGWIPNEPIPNHERDPFLTVPIPGINTSIRSIRHPNRMILLYLRYV